MHADKNRLNELSGNCIGGAVVGEYFANLLVENTLPLDPTTVKALDTAHMPPGA